jgi:predicted  nucleic acid-binding Zn-ribbon protein
MPSRIMTLKQRADQHDREIAAIRKLILTGMKMLNRNQTQINQLSAAQKTTEQNLQRLEASVEQLVNGLRRGGNGHAKLDLH